MTPWLHGQVVAYDFGIKHNILRRLASFGCRLTVVPADYPAEKVLEMNPDGVFLSNGPVRAACPLLPVALTEPLKASLACQPGRCLHDTRCLTLSVAHVRLQAAANAYC